MKQPIHNTYDRLGRMTSAIVAGISTNAYTCDSETMALITETQNGMEITRTTDALGRDTGFSLSPLPLGEGQGEGTAPYAVTYAYDVFGRFHSVSSSVQSAQSVVEYTRLANSELISGRSLEIGNSLLAVGYSYEPARSLITSVENSFDSAVISRYDYTNDELGRRTSRADSGLAFEVQPTYDDPATVEMPAFNAYTYNPRSEVTSATRRWGTPAASGDLVLGQQYAYDFDPIGNRITSSEGATDREATYAANELNQYTQRTVPGEKDLIGTAPTDVTVTVNQNQVTRQDAYWHHALEVDNDTVAAYPEVEVAAVYSNVFTAVTGRVFVAQTPEAFTYDDDGNLTQDGRFGYTWNGENRLIKAETRNDLPGSVPRVKVEYQYDHQGRMVWKEISTNSISVSTRTLVWDGYNIVQASTHTQTHTLTNCYIWGLDLSGSLQGAGGVGGLLTEVQDGIPYFAAYDANGNATEYLSTDGTLAAHYEYSPFGEIVVQSGDLAALFTHRFSTKPWCAVTGLSEYLFRKYNPGVGRWLNRDPVGERGGPNLRVVNRNDCVNRRDYLGLVADECCFCFVDRGSVKVSRSANEDDHLLEIDTTLQFANNRENAQGMTARPRCCGYRQFAYLKYWTRGGAPIVPPHYEDAWADDNYSRSDDQDGDRGLGHPGAYFTDLPGLEGLPSETDIVFQFCFMQQVYDTCQANVGIVWQHGPVCYQVSGTGPKRTAGKLPKESVPALPGDTPRLPTEYPTIGDLGMNLPYDL